ncbi:DUF1800 family protein [Nevskia sp.]|uniref:DUF1800 family protein n=1 Tax=Nevskia sp. TaxID=1929292 RepID=UPI0025FB3C63|nr:DUF1800 family protein [Nevskia sp.]
MSAASIRIQSLTPQATLLRSLAIFLAFFLTLGQAFAQTVTYARPVISSFSPSSGPVGTVVTVRGSKFTGANSVRIGQTNATFTIVNDTTLTLTVPANAPTGVVRVANPSFSTSTSARFTVTASAPQPVATFPQPYLVSRAPASGPVGTVVTIRGSGFTGATAVWLGAGRDLPFTVVSDTELRATVTASSTTAGFGILNPVHGGFSPDVFTITSGTPTVLTPIISSFLPASGPVGTVVTLTGSNFTGATSVTVGASAQIPVTNVTATSLSFTVPATATTGSIRVYNSSTNGTSVASFTVTVPAPIPVPSVLTFFPLSGPVGTVVTVTGLGFTGATAASIGNSTRVAVSGVTATSLTFTVPAGAASGPVQVHNASYSGSSPLSFTVTVPAAVPAITSFAPSSGPVGTVVTVTGTGFTGANSVSIGGVAATGVTVASNTSLSFTVPNGASSGTIRVANPTNNTTSTASFTVTTVTVPPVPPVTPVGAMGLTAASRLLTQGTFGASPASLDAAAAQSYDAWFAAQAAAPTSLILPSVPNKDAPWVPTWWKNVVTGPDQLRQRMAFALSEILVVSDQAGSIMNRSETMAAYYDLLSTNALGNYRTLLERVTLSPTMGLYLNMFRNNKENLATGVHADQNYAREIMQLFSIGLVRLNLDGSVQKDAAGVPLPTYSQADVEGMAKVMTGWASAPVTQTGEGAWQYDIDYIRPMVAYESHHDTSAKTIVGGVVVPAGGTAAQDLRIALDTLFNHPNVGPFIALRLIQRLVTSNPSPAYIARVATVFNNNGSGVRGDLLAVARAILTDPEAVNPGDNTAGKLREPLIRVTNLWRAFSASDSNGNVSEYGLMLQSSDIFAQSVLSSPSVFNFFAPDYQRSGPLKFAGLLAPEFQTTNENTLVLTANMLQRQVYQYVDSNGVRNAGPNGYSEAGNLGPTSVLLKTAAWEPYAANPATLVDRLNLVFMQGLMPAAMRTTLINYASAIPASSPASRVIETTDLLINSPQFAVQR